MRLAWWVLTAALVVAAPVRADDEVEKSSYRVVVDRVELEPAVIGGQRLRVFVSAMTLGGQRIDLTDPKTVKVFTGSTELKEPFALGRYDGTGSDTAIVVLVQSTVEYTDVLPTIGDALDGKLIAELPEHTQLAVLSYGEAIGKARLAPVKQLRGKTTELATDGTAGQPALLDTLERALLLLKRAKTDPEGRPMRKMIVVIGDGRDLSGDRERVTRLGVRAAKEGVRIHSFAFSPTDVRRPLLLLGELSKRSLGTFRWIRSAAATSWAPAFEQLRDEINGQYVLTYFAPVDTDLAGKRIKVATSGRAVATSLNEVKAPELACAGEPCDGYCTGTRCVKPRTAEGRGVLGWILLVGGVIVGALVVLGVIGYVMTRRQQARGITQAAHGHAPPVGVPGMVPAPPHAHPHVASGPPAMAAPAAPVSAGPRLYIASGPRTGEVIALRHGFLIGKQLGCDLQIDDGYTSSQHAQIGMDHFGNCRLYDRGSTNGTFVNGVRITDHPLEHGNTLRIGSTELRFLAQ